MSATIRYLKRNTWFLCIIYLFSISLSSSVVLAQESKPTLTLQDIWAAKKFRGKRFRGGKWAARGPVITFTKLDTATKATNLMSFDLEKNEQKLILDGNKLHAADVDRLIKIQDYTFTKDRKKLLIYTDSARVWRRNTKGYYYIYDFDTEKLTPLAKRDDGYQMFAKISPDEKYAAFVRNRNLFLVELKNMKETQLTKDGSPGKIINGTSDWVYEEEFFLRDGWSWSPDSKYIAFYKLDESETNEFVMADLRGLKPELTKFRFPLPGEANSKIEVGVIEVSNTKTKFFKTQTWDKQSDDFQYIPRMGWTPEIDGKHYVWMFRLNRDQNVLDLLYGDPKKKAIKTILTEKEDTWLEVSNMGKTDSKITFLDDDEHFIWQSERDGFNHLYLYKNNGEFVRQITKGNWKVTAFQGVDADQNVYFTATAENPAERHLYHTPLLTANGAAPVKVTQDPGWHSINMSGDLHYFIDTFSNREIPTTTLLDKSDGSAVKVLENNDALKKTIQAYDLPETEFLQLRGADGTMLHAYMIKPTDFDPGKKYPLLIYTYGGPGAQQVTDRWSGSFHLWHQYLAQEKHIIVACVDNRGAAGYGKAFASTLYKKMGTVEPLDQIAAAKHWAQLPYIDAARIAIWGWSYGGYNTLVSLLKYDGPNTVKLGVAVAPGVDWRLYDTIYTERYMSTPQKNEAGYKESNPANFANQMSSSQKLLIIQGTLDDNVHFQHTIHMVTALEKANKQFQLMLYPGGNHGMIGTKNPKTYLHLFTTITNFIEKNL